MKLESSDELEDYLKSRGKIVLDACPGGGKTTAIALKIGLLEKEIEDEKGKFSGIACLSFTNAAKDEIKNKYREVNHKSLEFPHIVSTIDSFINLYITLPFYYLMGRHYKRPKILEDNKRVNKLFVRYYKDNKGILKEALKNDIKEFKTIDGSILYHKYKPEKVRLEPDGSYTWEGKIPAENIVNSDVFKNYCKYIKRVQFEEGLITTNDSAYIAYYILGKYPRIANWLVSRFPCIIIDEAQDNSLLQHKIFESLTTSGLEHIEFIGDPYQSLYEWRDADPQLFIDKCKDDSYTNLPFTGNRRSPNHIINCFSLLRPITERTIKYVGIKTDKKKILVYRFINNERTNIIKHFEKKCKSLKYIDRKIVVRGNTKLNEILGRNALQEPWHETEAYDLIRICIEFEDRNLKEAINLARRIVIDISYPKMSYSDRSNMRNELSGDYNFNAKLIEFIEHLPSLDLTINDWTKKTEEYVKKTLKLEYPFDLKLKKRASTKVDKETFNDPISNHFKRINLDEISTITTVHKVKGKTLDAILILFDEKNHGNNINFKDIMPDKKTFLKEKKRIIYVAMSRPRHLLAMAFPDSVSEEEITKKFGEHITIINPSELL
jgi:superfamily I DNA/RNA helicase